MAVSCTIDERMYDEADQEGFAALSGDRNPIHLDAVRARREIFGDVVVHGMHLVLRALDALVAARGAALPLRLRGSFPSPAFLRQQVTTRLDDDGSGSLRLSGESGGQTCIEATITPAGIVARAASPSPAAPDGASPAGADQIAAPPSGAGAAARALSFAQLAGRTGQVDLWLDPAAAERRLPRLHSALGCARMAELLALTRLIGMECPGLHSIFSAFDLDLEPGAPAAPTLRFAVERVVAGASFVKLRVAGGGLTGVLDAFFRPPPQAQASFAEARARVAPGDFARQRALVVGGSRGLGEATAKLVAAGGGRVIITYHTGRRDAERVAAEIVSAGGRCDVLRYEVGAPQALAPALAALRPTHVYYFASPKIFVKRRGPYDPSLYARFVAVYVEGLEALIATCRAAGTARLRVFVPSSTVLDAPIKNLEEYADAKAAAEARCAALARAADLEVIVQRLPRVATDQTLTLVRHPARSALDIMTAVVRGMNDSDG